MEPLDPEVCERARQARDARFDGHFFIGVVTTGIYCRPICPVRPPRAENVRFFASAAAATEAGFRPCLRCRPEASPGTPAWLGTGATVSRALRLIAEGALDSGSVTQLADRLGVGPRHLRRLFDRHLGASPRAVARTRRLLFAKTLIDETDLPLTQIGLTAGFGSVRRFNAAFRDCYGRPPSALRRRHGRRDADHDDFVLQLSFRPPYDWPALASYLKLRATPGVEVVTSEGYRRTIAYGGSVGQIAVRPIPGRHFLELRVSFSDPRGLFPIVERCRRMFDTWADPSDIAAQLCKDPKMRPLLARHPGLRLPGAWDGFELGVRAILGQQVSVKGATTLAGRLAQAYGEPLGCGADGDLRMLFPTPDRLATADVASLVMPRARGVAIQTLARAVRDGEVTFHTAPEPATLERQLTALRGIGRWTAQYVAMRAMNEPDAFPAADLGLVRAASCLGIAETPAELAHHAHEWRPWRAYAAMHLWRSESEAGGGTAHLKSATSSPAATPAVAGSSTLVL